MKLGDYQMLQVVNVPEASPGDSDTADEGLLLPVPGQDANTVLVEPRDGDDIIAIDVTGMLLEYRGETVIRVPNIRTKALVTDARLTVACSNYDKGGGWRGDPITMTVFNAVSKARAAVRSHGKMLVGHVRYPWLARVGSTPKSGIGTEERLVLDVYETGDVPTRLILGLSTQSDAAELAALVARRAAAYRLACEEDLDSDERRSLQRLRAASPLLLKQSYSRNQAYFHEFPTYWHVSEKSARLAPRAGRVFKEDS
ncbi:MAG TPA: hypothetical protein VN714_00185 [Trebonia sp.]|jgi:hypothetical protein|nr:hypothetical protein [Trebonia sp.]